ncbi:MAG: hypothetical protein C0413_05130 [Clostridiales bacterium]|nr:hypothetical protein [Clostridiales bacterium]
MARIISGYTDGKQYVLLDKKPVKMLELAETKNVLRLAGPFQPDFQANILKSSKYPKISRKKLENGGSGGETIRACAEIRAGRSSKLLIFYECISMQPHAKNSKPLHLFGKNRQETAPRHSR